MPTAAIDVGSSSVKAALLEGTEILPGSMVSAAYETSRDHGKAEVNPDELAVAIRRVAGQLNWSDVTGVGLTGMGPAWLAMDDRGRPVSPIVTHQDQTHWLAGVTIEEAIGKEEHLALAGNRPASGGISSTVAKDLLPTFSNVHKVGHWPTWIAFLLTGRWAMDPSNAGFSGLMDVSTGRWSPLLCETAGVEMDLLPEIVDAAGVIGETRPNDLGIPPGLPVFGGFIDGSGPILLAGATAGQIVHSAGSTDVLAMCLDRPMPREGLLCRPLGTGRKWVSAATSSGGGDAIEWLHQLAFSELPFGEFVKRLPAFYQRKQSSFMHPLPGGNRQAVLKELGQWRGLTLGTTRNDLASAVVTASVSGHAVRAGSLLDLADELGIDDFPDVVTTGGGTVLASLMHKAWVEAGLGFDWVFRDEPHATLRGIGAIARER